MATRTETRWLAAALLLGACGAPAPAAPPASDLDLAALRSAFACGTGGDAEPCRLIDALATGTAPTLSLTEGELARWVGVDHCVHATAGPDFDVYQVVYLRSDAAPPGTARLPYRAGFGTAQLGAAAPAADRAALAAWARGEAVTGADPTRLLPPDDPSIYRPLVRAPGTSISDEPPIWYLRASGDRLLLASTTIQGGCVSELRRIP